MAALSFVSSRGWVPLGPTGNVVLYPTGMVAGDLMLLLLHTGGSSGITPPTGWASVSGLTAPFSVAFKYATSSDVGSSGTVTPTGPTNVWPWAHLTAWRGFTATSPVRLATQNATSTTPTAAVVGPFVEVDAWWTGSAPGSGVDATLAGIAPAPLARLGEGSVSSFYIESVAAGYLLSPAGAAGGGRNLPTSGPSAGALLVVLSGNTPPTAPTLLAPVGGVSIDVAVAQRFSVQNNDPDVGDTISVLGLRYRPVGGSIWTTLTQSSPLLFRDLPAGTFAPGTSLEWQAQVTDAGGLVGPWSASEFFYATTAPPAPTFTAPVNNATIGAPTGATVSWSTPSQDAYQLRVLADAAGTADTSTVYFDSGTVADPTVRTAAVARPVNSRVEHTQVRVRYQGLWSNWADLRNTVTYTPPAVPRLGLTAGVDAVQVTLAQPTPAGGQPQVVYTDLFRRPTGSTGSLRVGRNLAAGIWPDYTVGSGIDYEYQAQAVGTNGSTSRTDWTGATGTVVIDPTVPGGPVNELEYADADYAVADFA